MKYHGSQRENPTNPPRRLQVSTRFFFRTFVSLSPRPRPPKPEIDPTHVACGNNIGPIVGKTVTMPQSTAESLHRCVRNNFFSFFFFSENLILTPIFFFNRMLSPPIERKAIFEEALTQAPRWEPFEHRPHEGTAEWKWWMRNLKRRIPKGRHLQRNQQSLHNPFIPDRPLAQRVCFS
jgi:hypothetical protein